MGICVHCVCVYFLCFGRNDKRDARGAEHQKKPPGISTAGVVNKHH
jgi:hypothetical protein